MDDKATRYFVKLHIIAGQMNTERMNNTDTFYTLTGRSGEIFNGEKVRVALMFTPRGKLYTESVPTAGSLRVCQRTSLLRKRWQATPQRVR